MTYSLYYLYDDVLDYQIRIQDTYVKSYINYIYYTTVDDRNPALTIIRNRP